MRRVLVTGSRELTNYYIVADALWAQARIAGGLNKLTVVHGACPTGADRWAHEFCKSYPAVTEERYPAKWETYGKSAGHLRNQVMVNTEPDVVLAFPRGEARGTYDCVTRAKTAKLPVIFG